MNKTQMKLALYETKLVEERTKEPTEPFQVVDLFAGPGGLGEGFSACRDGSAFEIVVSAEMDPKAWETLRLRAFYRLLKRRMPSRLGEYYAFCNDSQAATFSPSEHTEWLWEEAAEEAKCITLGTDLGNRILDDALDDRLDPERPWVLIGGPPCQAYSVVGRARNQAKADYRAEDDPRHFLYKEYLRIIRERQPTIFVMENVKGILSSKVNNQGIFSSILRDLSDPREALDEDGRGRQYRIFSLATGASFGPGDDPGSIDPRAFIIKAEDYGIPQARHRVILVGIATDCPPCDPELMRLLRCGGQVTTEQVLGGLPKLRSTLTKTKDSLDSWTTTVRAQVAYLRDEIGVMDPAMWIPLNALWSSFDAPETSGALRLHKGRDESSEATGVAELDAWYLDKELSRWLNHKARGHMEGDLRRYIFAAVYASVHKSSPKGHSGFSVAGLAPEHKNWHTGKFSDRFRVQLRDRPATTVTSHISKDGHYFIHYDPCQCRSLTVREAARLQTFPDNYFFQGNRTQQFHQVGNAVPPLLARQIAEVVLQVLGEFEGVRSLEITLAN